MTLSHLVTWYQHKSGPFRGVFWVGRSSTFVSNLIFLRTNKADQKHCENWRYKSGSEFHKTSPMCERGEWRKRQRDSITLKLETKKQAPLGSGTIS